MEKQPIRSPENRERPLAGKVALITGCSRDIGAEIAKALAQKGVSIIGNYREKEKRAVDVEKTLSFLGSFFGAESRLVQADITIEDDRIKLEETIKNLFGGKLDFLILNASGPTEEINVTANNRLADKFLPLMPPGSTIVLMQSVPGHFEPQLKGKLPEFYRPVAEAKYKGEQSLRKRLKEFEERGINFIVICPPEVSDTSNIKVFTRYDPQISVKNAEMSRNFNLPTAITKEEVGEKVAELLKRQDLPMGYTEFFT